jgi:hypothetical protein
MKSSCIPKSSSTESASRFPRRSLQTINVGWWTIFCRSTRITLPPTSTIFYSGLPRLTSFPTYGCIPHGACLERRSVTGASPLGWEHSGTMIIGLSTPTWSAGIAGNRDTRWRRSEDCMRCMSPGGSGGALQPKVCHAHMDVYVARYKVFRSGIAICPSNRAVRCLPYIDNYCSLHLARYYV